LTGHTEWVNSVRFCREGTLLVSASDDSTIRLWDVQKRSCIQVLNGHVGQVQIAVPSPLGFTHRFDTEEDDGYLSTLNRVGSLPELQPGCATDSSNNANQAGSSSRRNIVKKETTSTAASSKNPIIISGSLDNTIKLWDMITGKCIRTLFGHVEGVWSLAYDTLRIVSGSHDKTVRVWDLGSGKCMYALEGHNGPVTSVALSDTKIISTSDDGDIRIWDYGVLHS